MKNIMIAIRYLAKKIFTLFVLAPLGVLYCLIRFRGENTCYVVPCPHIGDVLFTFGYLNAYRRKNQIEKVTVVCKDSFKELAGMYPEDIDEIIIISDIALKLIMAIDASYFYTLVLRKFIQMIIIVPANHFREGFDTIRKFPNTTLIGCIKYGVLALREQDSFTCPTVENANKDEMLKRLGILPGKTIILSPYTHECGDELIEGVLEAIALRYKNKGYRVLTNVSAKWHKPVKHTEALECTLREALLIGNHCNCVVGIRSGFLDLLLLSGTMVLALYSSDYFDLSFFDLSAMPIKEKGQQYKMTGDYNGDMETIYEIIDGNMNQGEMS